MSGSVESCDLKLMSDQGLMELARCEVVTELKWCRLQSSSIKKEASHTSGNIVTGRVNKSTMETELEKIAYVYGDVCVRTKKQRRKRQKHLVIELLLDYAKNCTLHGIRYIVERGLSLVEKLFWFITVVASILLCSMYIYNVYHKWITSPVIVTVNGRLSSVGTVPFPAVTICSQIKVNANAYNFTAAIEKYNNDSLHGHDLVKFAHISTMCEYIFEGRQRNLTNVSLVKDITEVALKLDDMFFYCTWNSGSDKEKDKECSEYFSRVYTEEGVCYTTNTLAATDIFEKSIQSDYSYLKSNSSQVGWSLDDGYNYSIKDSFPRRGKVLGSDPDMEIVLVHNPELQDKECNQLYSGYKIYLQHPADFPQSSLYYYAAIPNQLTSLAINFHELNSDPSLKAYSSEIRQCYFPSDRKLRYFKIYTAKNCQAECLSNHTFRLCRCVGLAMPHDNSSQICSSTIENKYCMIDAKDTMAQSEINTDIGLEMDGCRCLPACNTVEYDAEILKTEYFLGEKIKKIPDYNNENAYSKIDLYFKKPQFVTMQRRELFGVTDLLANIGGLLGVFLGFSFLSLIEIFYFLTIRVGCTLKRDLEEEKSKKPKMSHIMNELASDKNK